MSDRKRQDQWLIDYSRNNYRSGNYRINPDGSVTTELSMGVNGPDGQVYALPSFDNRTGRNMTPEQAMRRFQAEIAAGLVPVDPDGASHNERMRLLHPAVEADATYIRSRPAKWDMRKQDWPNALVRMLYAPYNPTINAMIKNP
jgi:hypothetical protein